MRGTKVKAIRRAIPNYNEPREYIQDSKGTVFSNDARRTYKIMKRAYIRGGQ